MEIVRRLHEKLERFRAYFCANQTANFYNADFRDQIRVFPTVETG